MRNVKICFQGETYEKIKDSKSKLNNQPVEQKNNNSKLWLGISLGMFRVGLMGFLV
jgi:hypothetical protein